MLWFWSLDQGDPMRLHYAPHQQRGGQQAWLQEPFGMGFPTSQSTAAEVSTIQLDLHSMIIDISLLSEATPDVWEGNQSEHLCS